MKPKPFFTSYIALFKDTYNTRYTYIYMLYIQTTEQQFKYIYHIYRQQQSSHSRPTARSSYDRTAEKKKRETRNEEREILFFYRNAPYVEHDARPAEGGSQAAAGRSDQPEHAEHVLHDGYPLDDARGASRRRRPRSLPRVRKNERARVHGTIRARGGGRGRRWINISTMCAG